MSPSPDEPLTSLKVALAYHSRKRQTSGHLRTDHTISPVPSFGQLIRRDRETTNVGELTRDLQLESNIFAQADYLNRIYDIWYASVNSIQCVCSI